MKYFLILLTIASHSSFAQAPHREQTTEFSMSALAQKSYAKSVHLGLKIRFLPNSAESFEVLDLSMSSYSALVKFTSPESLKLAEFLKNQIENIEAIFVEPRPNLEVDLRSSDGVIHAGYSNHGYIAIEKSEWLMMSESQKRRFSLAVILQEGSAPQSGPSDYSKTLAVFNLIDAHT